MMVPSSLSSSSNSMGTHGTAFDLSPSSPFYPHWKQYPKTYVAPRVPANNIPLIDRIDGDISKDDWRDVPFSSLFDDIRGSDAPDEERPNNERQSTRFKCCWDDTHLYIIAVSQNDDDAIGPTEAHFTERNSPIFQKDSDFEIFVDPIGSNHNYKEFEVNAIDTVWNLLLDKPYGDDGREHSGRVARPGDDLYYEVYHQKSATKVVRGTINDPTGQGATWSVEVALSFEDLWSNVTSSAVKDVVPGPSASFHPTAGSMIRINFSRVERKGKINWTWQPMVTWDPARRTYRGVVDMHRPDAWGYLVLGDGNDSDSSTSIGSNKNNNGKERQGDVPYDPSWPGRLAAMNVYYAQKAYYETTGNKSTYASCLDDLKGLVDNDIVKPFDINIRLTADGAQYDAIVIGNPDGSSITIAHDRLLSVHHADSPQLESR